MSRFSFVFVGLALILALGQFHSADGAPNKKAPGKGGKPGGAAAKLGARIPPDDKVKKMVEQLESEIRGKICGINADICEDYTYALVPQGYRKQVAGPGNNYFVSILLKDTYYHARIYEKSSDDVLELVDLIGPKKKTDEIRYF